VIVNEAHAYGHDPRAVAQAEVGPEPVTLRG
jgi:hypothetical protein